MECVHCALCDPRPWQKKVFAYELLSIGLKCHFFYLLTKHDRFVCLQLAELWTIFHQRKQHLVHRHVSASCTSFFDRLEQIQLLKGDWIENWCSIGEKNFFTKWFCRICSISIHYGFYICVPSVFTEPYQRRGKVGKASSEKFRATLKNSRFVWNNWRIFSIEKSRVFNFVNQLDEFCAIVVINWTSSYCCKIVQCWCCRSCNYCNWLKANDFGLFFLELKKEGKKNESFFL